MGDAEHEVILIKNKQKEELSCEMERAASPIRDNNSLGVQLEAVRLNRKRTWEMCKFSSGNDLKS